MSFDEVEAGHPDDMQALFSYVMARIADRADEGAVSSIGGVVIGVVLGVALVIFGIIKFLIPGE